MSAPGGNADIPCPSMDEFSYRATGSFLSKQLQERADKKCRPYTCEQKPANPLRLKSNFPSNLKLIWAVQSATKKYFAYHFGKSEL